MTGLSGAGKSTIAFALEKRIIDLGKVAFVLDGDVLMDYNVGAPKSRTGEVGESVVVDAFDDEQLSALQQALEEGVDRLSRYFPMSLATVALREPDGVSIALEFGQFVQALKYVVEDGVVGRADASLVDVGPIDEHPIGHVLDQCVLIEIVKMRIKYP